MELAIEKGAVRVRSEFDPFFRTHFPKVARAAALITGDAGSGQDAAQDAFMRVYQRWGSMRSDDHARNLAYKAALNLARSHRRRHLRLVPSGLHHADQVAEPARTPPAEWFEVVDALASLSERQRACVVLVDYAGLDSSDAGGVLRIGAATVRVHLLRGRRALRARLGLAAAEDDDHEG